MDAKSLSQLLKIEDIFSNERNTDKSLDTMLNKIYQKSTQFDLSKELIQEAYWDEKLYGLERTDLFKNLNEPQKQNVFTHLSGFILSEGLYIEQLGFTFNSKMMLLNHSIENKSLYASYAYDEALHFRMLSKFAARPDNLHQMNPFLQFLADIVVNGGRENLILFIQIMLEGIGLEHYSELAKYCTHPELKVCLDQIVKDEAFHHGGGKILFDSSKMSRDDEEFLIERSHAMLIFFQLTHMPLMFAITSVLGPLDEKTTLTFFEQMDVSSRTTGKMQFLRSQFQQAGLDNVLKYCEQNKLLTPNDYGQLYELYSESVKK